MPHSSRFTANPSRFITTFRYKDDYYCFNRLHMGLSLATFVMQRFTNRIVRFIRQFTHHIWSHIDDILVAHHDENALKEIVSKCVSLLSSIKWNLNSSKSVLVLRRTITFLGSIWGAEGARRSPKCTSMCLKLVQYIGDDSLYPKTTQRVEGYFNYYLYFVGNFSSLVNMFLLMLNRSRFGWIIHWLIKERFISFNLPSCLKQFALWSDATLKQIAFTECKSITFVRSHFSLSLSIQVNELAIQFFVGLNKADHNFLKYFKLLLFTDNINVLFYSRKGRCKWNRLHLAYHFKNLRLIEYLRRSNGPTVSFIEYPESRQFEII